MLQGPPHPSKMPDLGTVRDARKSFQNETWITYTQEHTKPFLYSIQTNYLVHIFSLSSTQNVSKNWQGYKLPDMDLAKSF